MEVPAAARHDIVDFLHGHRVEDPYRWLEDPADPATVTWSEGQDRLWEAWVAGYPGRARWRSELAGLVPGYRGAPLVIGERSFWMQRAAPTPGAADLSGGEDHAVLWVGDGSGERRLVDPNSLSPDGTTTLDGWSPSIEGDRLAYLVSTGGDEESSLWVIDVASGDALDGPIDRLRYSSLAWLPGGDELLYVRRLTPEQVPPGEEAFHRRVWRHRLGTDPDTDQLLFGDGVDPTAYLGVEVSDDGQWMAVTVSLGTAPRNEVHLARLTPAGAAPDWQPMFVGVDARAWVHFDRRGQLWVVTDLDAPRRRLCVTDPADHAVERWQEVIGEDPDGAVLEGFSLAGDELVVVRSRHACSEVTVHDRGTGELQGTVDLPGLGSADVTGRPDEGRQMWLGYTDFTTPNGVWALDPVERVVSAGPAARAGGGRAGVDTRRVAYTSADGTEVRMTVIARAGDSGPRPAVLYGYGGFDVSLTPSYSSSIVAWVDAGGVWAVANLRGGGEEGQGWHRAGMRAEKQRVFEDFEAAAAYLVHEGWTTRDQLGIFGGSNGGLLVGAALTRQPESYRAVVCSAPLLDMVRYEQFGLGITWNDEYGTAAEPTELEWLLGYSPYHHVRKGSAYPAVLFTIFDGDSRVDPLHARKMAAALQWAAAVSGDSGPTRRDRPVLVRREAQVGHGARAVSRGVDLAADELTFLGSQLGLTP